MAIVTCTLLHSAWIGVCHFEGYSLQAVAAFSFVNGEEADSGIISRRQWCLRQNSWLGNHDKGLIPGA